MSLPNDDDEPQGRFLGMPYDRRRPTRRKLGRRVWNPDNHRVLVPKAFGWGYGINFAEVARRLHLRR
jgi:hypothetical protein